jgi:hypothetical protein
MKKILSLLVFTAMAVFANAQDVKLVPSIPEGTKDLVIKFENTSGKTIANCNFLLTLPEGITLTPKGKKFSFEEGDATEGMTFSIKQYAGTTDKWSIAVYDGEFDEEAGTTIMTLPLTAEELKGEAVFTEVAFGDPDKNNICRIDELKFDLSGTAINSISAEQTKSGVIYNVAGQRVSKATKGIFIVDGKKVAVK